MYKRILFYIVYKLILWLAPVGATSFALKITCGRSYICAQDYMTDGSKSEKSLFMHLDQKIVGHLYINYIVKTYMIFFLIVKLLVIIFYICVKTWCIFNQFLQTLCKFKK